MASALLPPADAAIVAGLRGMYDFLPGKIV